MFCGDFLREGGRRADKGQGYRLTLTIDHAGPVTARIFLAFFILEAASADCLVAPVRCD